MHLYLLGVSDTVQLYIWGWGHCLHQCMAVDVFVSAAMHHVQHMLPSSSLQREAEP